ncbi:MAG: hypothetical protein NZ928_01590 [Endomicrobia bacterium]|nr:hypothetical protein [Endomicrobiia bacterium]MDW8056367.1 hypothetical protein [Elusimicrobiota bacterium]
MEKLLLTILVGCFVILLISIIYTLSVFVVSKRLRLTSNKKRLTESDTTNLQDKDYEIEIAYALISEKLKIINDRLLELYKAVGASTRDEIITEMEHLKTQIAEIEQKTQEIKSQHDGKKQEVKHQILETYNMFGQIKQLLKLDYENLIAQREHLMNLLKKQELEYKHVVENYSTEIQKLSAIIEDLKQRYPEDLTRKLNIRVMNKAETLELLQKQYEQLKKTTQERFTFLDEVITKKSSEIEKFITSVKRQGEQEISQLKGEIDNLRNEIAQLDTEIKDIVKYINIQQHEKDEIIKRMKAEIEYLRHQEFEINNLKLREDYLNNEIQKLNLEYQNLQQEYEELNSKKAQQIKQLEDYSEQTLRNVLTEWEDRKNVYEEEIRRLRKRQATLQKRRQRIIEIQKKLERRYKTEQEKIGQELAVKKQEFEKLSRQTRQEISKKINKIENIYSQLKQKIELLKSKLEDRIKIYDDKISEVKQRSVIREERIRRNIEKYKREYENILKEMSGNVEKFEQETELAVEKVLSEKKRMETQIQLKKEQLETYLETTSKMIAKIEIVRIEADKFEQEINNKQHQIISRFDKLLSSIEEQKQQLIYKLEDMLKLQEEIIEKHPEKTSEKIKEQDEVPY